MARSASAARPSTRTGDELPALPGAMLVCEWHPGKPWTPEGCECGAGMPCPVCRPQHHIVGPDEAVAEALRHAVNVTIDQVFGRR